MPKLLFRNNLWLLAITLLVMACKAKKTAQATPEVKETKADTAAVRKNPPMRGNMAAMAPLIIYKTKNDYSKNVPVTLSEDKKEIVNYPAPSDLLVDGKLQYPTALQDGYWMDKRGINTRTAYLKITYEEYTKPGYIPDPAVMKTQLLDTDPITEIYNCGPKSKFQNPEEEINRAIKDKKLGVFEKIK